MTATNIRYDTNNMKSFKKMPRSRGSVPLGQVVHNHSKIDYVTRKVVQYLSVKYKDIFF